MLIDFSTDRAHMKSLCYDITMWIIIIFGIQIAFFVVVDWCWIFIEIHISKVNESEIDVIFPVFNLLFSISLAFAISTLNSSPLRYMCRHQKHKFYIWNLYFWIDRILIHIRYTFVYPCYAYFPSSSVGCSKFAFG